MKRVPINQAFIDAIEGTDENLGRYTSQMYKWARYIEKEIGSLRSHKVKAKSMTLDGCSLKLPDNCYMIIGILPGNHEEECNIQYKSITDTALRIDDMRAGEDVYDRDLTKYWVPLETTWIKDMLWEEVGDEVFLTNAYKNYEVTLVYLVIDLDKNGYWLVNDSHLPAITAYIEYMYAKKYRWKVFKSERLLRESHMAMIRELERNYNIAVRNARAQDMRENKLERSIRDVN